MANVEKLDINQASEEHFARIHRAALVMTGNPWDADDLAQETFLMYALPIALKAAAACTLGCTESC